MWERRSAEFRVLSGASVEAAEALHALLLAFPPPRPRTEDEAGTEGEAMKMKGKLEDQQIAVTLFNEAVEADDWTKAKAAFTRLMNVADLLTDSIGTIIEVTRHDDDKTADESKVQETSIERIAITAIQLAEKVIDKFEVQK